MTQPAFSPAFGTADLTNCDRELINLPASIQPHGALLILHPERLHVLQATLNTAEILGSWGTSPLGKSIETFDPELARIIRALPQAGEQDGLVPTSAQYDDGGTIRHFEAMVHRLPHEGIAVELEPVIDHPEGLDAEGAAARISRVLAQGITALGSATTMQSLGEETVRIMQELCGYDRVMVYKFDPEGHGEIVAEAKRPDLAESFLGLHYPSSDIPKQARELYLRNRIRLLADVSYSPAPLFPRLSPVTGADVDMSMCHLRSMSPLHLQYLANMGVRATLVTSLTSGAQLWGLIACHHYSPRRIPFEVRAACDILSEIVSTRVSALQSLAVAHAELLVKRLEQQIVESLATTGDWHTTLFSSPRLLLQAADAHGAALLHDDQLVTAGNVPSSEDIRRIVRWIATHHPGEPLVATHALPRLAPEFAHLTTSGTGILAIALAGRSMDYLVWFRPEQVQSVRWGGDPNKAFDNSDPNHLSPRRSFAVWTEETRGTSRHWTEAELGIAARVRSSLVDMVQQVRAVRVLIAQEQLQRVMRAVQLAPEPTVIMGSVGQLLVVNRAFRELLGQTVDLSSAEDLQHLFTSEAEVLEMLTALRVDRRLWAGELTLRAGGDLRIPLAVRAEPVPGEDGNDLGYVLFATDLRARLDTEAARQRVQDVMVEARQRSRPAMADAETTRSFSTMLEAILTSARRSVTDVSTSGTTTPFPAAMASIESLTRRAAEVALQLESYAASRRRR